MDKLDYAYDQQKEFQKHLGVMPLDSQADLQAYIEKMTLALHDEASEVLRETQWKDWKRTALFNRQAIKEELIDVFKIWLNLCIAMDFSPNEILTEFLNKTQVTYKRIEEGY